MNLENVKHNAGILFKVAALMEADPWGPVWGPAGASMTMIAQQIQDVAAEILRLEADVERGKALCAEAAECLADRIKYSNGLERAATRVIAAIQASEGAVNQGELVLSCRDLEAAILDVPAAAGPRT
jgi:hypothetical protein